MKKLDKIEQTINELANESYRILQLVNEHFGEASVEFKTQRARWYAYNEIKELFDELKK